MLAGAGFGLGCPGVCLASAASPSGTGTPSTHLRRLLGDDVVLNMVVGTAAWSEWAHKEPLILWEHV